MSLGFRYRERRLYICIHVDEGSIFASSYSEIDEALLFWSSKFEIKVFDNPTNYSGFDVTYENYPYGVPSTMEGEVAEAFSEARTKNLKDVVKFVKKTRFSSWTAVSDLPICLKIIIDSGVQRGGGHVIGILAGH